MSSEVYSKGIQVNEKSDEQLGSNLAFMIKRIDDIARKKPAMFQRLLRSLRFLSVTMAVLPLLHNTCNAKLHSY